MRDLLKLSIAEASGLLKSKAISSEDLTKAYLQQIKTVEPKIDAYLHIAEKIALEKARAVDAKRQAGEMLSDIAGLPMALKDNMSTTDMPTTCGSKMLSDYRSPFDATVVKDLRTADAVILGKLNMDEFAMGSTTEHSYFKPTKNPVNTDRVPGGSSGGSAAAVGSYEALYTLGSDTGGSIRQPASFCGVVGLKPTYGSISRYGLIAFASSLDQIGPLTRSVEDMAMILPHLMKRDPMDSTSIAPGHIDLKAVFDRDLKQIRVALPAEYLEEGIDPEVKAAILQGAKQLEKLGAVVETVSLKNVKHALPAYYIISSAEASSNLARFDGVKYGYRHPEFDNLEELYSKSRKHGFGTEVKRRILLGTYALSSGYYDAYYKKALKVKTLIMNEFDALFETYDAVLSPVAPTTAYPFDNCSDDALKMYLGDIYTVPVNIAGLPAVSLNCGFDQDGMPIGMQLIADKCDEQVLLKIGYAYEKSITEGGGYYGQPI